MIVDSIFCYQYLHFLMMRRCFTNVILSLLFALQLVESRVILDFRLFDFINTNGLTKDKKSCEVFPLDKCDPKFIICLSSDQSKKCDILKKETGTFNNANDIPDVFMQKIPLERLPKNFTVEVTAEDQDGVGQHDIINEFKITFTPSMNEPKLGFLTPAVHIINLRLQYGSIFLCQDGFFGKQCEHRCENNSTEKSCLLSQCKTSCFNGNCKINPNELATSCHCLDGWQGRNCSDKIRICDSEFCNATQLVCQFSQCFCSTPGSSSNIYCMEKTDARRRSTILQSTDYGYVLTVVIIIIALMSLIAFVLVTFYKCNSRKLELLYPLPSIEYGMDSIGASSDKLTLSQNSLDNLDDDFEEAEEADEADEADEDEDMQSKASIDLDYKDSAIATYTV